MTTKHDLEKRVRDTYREAARAWRLTSDDTPGCDRMSVRRAREFDEEFHEAVRELGIYVAESSDEPVTSAALLDATERAERAEREAAVLRMTGGRDREALAALQAHVAAGHVLCTDCDGHGTWSIGADDGCEIPCECAACDGTGWRDAVSELAAYRLARAATR